MDYINKLTDELVEKILAKGVRDMPQNPAAQGYDERQIRSFYYIPEKEILNLIMEIETNIKKCFEKIADEVVCDSLINEVINARGEHESLDERINNSKIDVQIDGTSIVENGVANIETSATPTSNVIAKWNKNGNLKTSSPQDWDDCAQYEQVWIAENIANEARYVTENIVITDLPIIYERLDKIEDYTQKNVDQLYNILGQTVIYPLENTSKYSVRATADGSSDIIDGAYARIDKIQGSSVPYGEETVFGFTQFLTGNFYGIKSTGRNLLPYPYTDTTNTKLGVTFTDNGDGSVTVKGTSTNFATFILTKKFAFIDGKTYALSAKKIDANIRCAIIISYIDENGVNQHASNSITWSSEYTLNQIYLQVYPDVTIDAVVTPMLNIGSTALPYEPYKTSETIFNESYGYELEEYDYIDLENKQIVRQSGYLEQTEPFTEEQLANYTEYVLSKDGKAMVYKKENKTISSLYLDESFEYLAWVNGSEMIVKKPEANIPTADCTITTTYIAKKGVTE